MRYFYLIVGLLFLLRLWNISVRCDNGIERSLEFISFVICIGAFLNTF